MLGFLPGLGYLGSVDATIAAPRRGTPRVRVPAGSVGIAGRQTGIYPRESTGGWQIIGRTARKGFRHRVAHRRRCSHQGTSCGSCRCRPSEAMPSNDAPRASATRIGNSLRAITVIRPGLFTTVQDRGRWGHQGSGVPVSGAMDLVSHRVANLLVGNGDDAATLEVTLAGPELRIDRTRAWRSPVPICRPASMGAQRRSGSRHTAVQEACSDSASDAWGASIRRVRRRH